MSFEDTDSLILIVAEKQGGPWVRKDAGAIRRTLNDAYKSVRDVGRGMRMSPSRWVSERVFSGFGEKMDQLREVDSQIEMWTRDLDNCLDRALDADKVGRPLDVIFWLSQINNRLGLVAAKHKELDDVHEKDLAEFYGESENSYEDHDYFTGGEGKLVQAGIMDDLGRRVTNWKMERMYKDKIAKRKKSIEKLMREAKTLVSKVDMRLGMMSKARSSGDIARYMAALSDVAKMQQGFEKVFKTEFTANFSSLVDVLKRREKEIAAEEAKKAPALEQATEQKKNFGPPSPEAASKDNYVAPNEDAVETIRGLKHPRMNPSEDPATNRMVMRQQDEFSEPSVPNFMDQWGEQLGQFNQPAGPVDNDGNLGGMMDSSQQGSSPTTMRSEREKAWDAWNAAAPTEAPAFQGPIQEVPVEIAPARKPRSRVLEDVSIRPEVSGYVSPASEPAPEATPTMVPPPPQPAAAPAAKGKGKTKSKPKAETEELQPLQSLLSGIIPPEPDPYLKPGVIPPQAQVLPKKPPQKRPQKDAGLESLLLKKSHVEFYGELEKAAKLEDPYLLAMMLSKYSEQIDERDPETSEELLTLAEVIINA